jgi:hypothetical protein
MKAFITQVVIPDLRADRLMFGTDSDEGECIVRTRGPILELPGCCEVIDPCPRLNVYPSFATAST